MFLTHIAKSYRRWRLYRQTLAELSLLDDRSLADLGMVRSELPGVAQRAVFSHYI